MCTTPEFESTRFERMHRKNLLLKDSGRLGSCVFIFGCKCSAMLFINQTRTITRDHQDIFRLE